jgi:hypothetical protein
MKKQWARGCGGERSARRFARIFRAPWSLPREAAPLFKKDKFSRHTSAICSHAHDFRVRKLFNPTEDQNDENL